MPYTPVERSNDDPRGLFHRLSSGSEASRSSRLSTESRTSCTPGEEDTNLLGFLILSILTESQTEGWGHTVLGDYSKTL